MKKKKKEQILLVREVLAVHIMAIGLCMTTWLTIHNVKPAGYAIMQRLCMIDENAALLSKIEHCEERKLLRPADSILSSI